MHCKFEEFLVILAEIPSLVLHHLAVLVEFVRECILRVACVELKPFLLCNLHDFRSKFPREFPHLAENHVPCILVDSRPSRLALKDVHEVHERSILHVLAERSDKWRIPEARPYVFDFLEQHHHEVVKGEFLLALGAERCVDCPVEALEVGHHRAHHSARESAAHKEGTHVRVVRVNPVAEEFVNEFLGETAHFHVCVHVEILYEEAVGFHHLADGDYIRMDLAP